MVGNHGDIQGPGRRAKSSRRLPSRSACLGSAASGRKVQRGVRQSGILDFSALIAFISLVAAQYQCHQRVVLADLGSGPAGSH